MNDAIHDEIVVLSSEQVEISEFLLEETPSTLNSSSSKRVDASELRRRRIARIVGAVAIFFIVFSCVLLGISFNMSDDINDKGNVSFEAKLTFLCYRRLTLHESKFAQTGITFLSQNLITVLNDIKTPWYWRFGPMVFYPDILYSSAFCCAIGICLCSKNLRIAWNK